LDASVNNGAELVVLVHGRSIDGPVLRGRVLNKSHTRGQMQCLAFAGPDPQRGSLRIGVAGKEMTGFAGGSGLKL
jgi:hypothetical protein